MTHTPRSGGRHVREHDNVHTSLVTVRQHFPAAWPQRQITLDTIVIWTITGPGQEQSEGDDGAALARLRQEVIAVAEHLAAVEGLRAHSGPPTRPSIVHAVTSPIPGSPPVRQDGEL
jgi:hypothetical protein